MMRPAESLCGTLERRLIQGLARAVAHAASEEERARSLHALRDLIVHADPTLDRALLDPWTRVYLARSGLGAWARESIALFPPR